MTVLHAMADRFEQIRRAEGLSQEAFARRLGISRGAYQHYSRGGREIPSSVLAALLDEFGVDPYWMLRGDERGVATDKEELLVENAVSIVRMLQGAYERQGLKLSNEKLTTATKFAAFYLFDKREKISEGQDVIDKYAASQGEP
ncbi:helix-turn-helix transcriptional regulator [Tsuneonella suprasediminis]|uniref:helix-turn-helix domain-containing protein n=1 Tax=Tsuneonella suprasediminis TaxID=2306996 RepID=UPI002F954A5C